MYSISEIAILTDAKLLQMGTMGEVQHLLHDSRKLLFPGSTLFIALTGQTRDGHRYMKDLYQRGVRFFMVSKVPDLTELPEASILLVPDTLHALQQLAAAHRAKFTIPVIGVTGSNGKTIVKEWLNQLLEPDRKIIRSPRSYNSQLGVPLSVWLMQAQHELAVFEAGISHPGEMAALQSIIQPTLGIFTNLGLAHNEGFASMEEKLAEKWRLFQSATDIVMPSQENWINEWVSQHLLPGQRLWRWGAEPDAALRVIDTLRTEQHTQLELAYGGAEFVVHIPFNNDAAIENSLTCILMLLLLGVPISVIQMRMPYLHSVAMRMELKEGVNQCSIINDSYSADLSSLVTALDFLSQQQQHKNKAVILSDIPETGLTAAQLYERIGALLQHHGVRKLAAVGTVIGAHHHLFEQYGVQAHFFSDTDELLSRLEELDFHNETILIKGARRFQFERISVQLEKQVHQTVMEINLNALLQNLKWYQQRLNPGTRLMAMVKAFSYGSGSFEIANLLQFHGVDYLAVAYTDEGVALRKADIRLPIMVMNVASTGFEAIVTHNLEPVLYSIGLFNQFDAYLKQEGVPQYPVHLEVETGMNRLGFSESDLPELVQKLPDAPMKVQSVFSHLAASEDPAHDGFTAEQVRRFERFIQPLEKVIPYKFLRHIENTSGIFRHPAWQFDMVRLGIGLYGFDAAMQPGNPLEEVSTLVTTIAQIKDLAESETVGYGRRGKLSRPSRIATVRIGYADGYPRVLGNGVGKLLIKGQLVPTIGSICMDMTMIDVTDVPGVKEGDRVVVFGDGLPVSAVASWAGTIPYEILTGISQRVKRIYYQE